MNATELEFMQGIVSDTYSLYLSEQEPTTAQVLIESVFELRHSVRWYMVNSESHLDDMWATIRADGVLLDFIMTGTSNFIFKASIDPVIYKKLIDQSAKAVGWVEKSSIIDEAIVERAGKEDWYRDVFEQAPWVLFVYLLSTIQQIKQLQ